MGSMTRHHAGHLWTLTGDRWTAGDLVVTTSGAGKDREFSPGRDPGRRYGALSVACEAEVRIAKAQRERVIAELARMAREDAAYQEAEASRQRAADAALEEQARGRRYGAGAALVLLLVLACAGVWGTS